MGNAVRIFVLHRRSVRPFLRPISSHRYKRTGWNWSVVRLPFFHPLQRKRVIGILCRLRMNVDDDERQNHFLERDLVDRAQATNEMRGWIDVRAPLPDVSVNLGEKSFPDRAFSFLVPVGGFAFFIGKSMPMRNAGRKLMGKIYELFAGQDLLDLQE